jgi:tetrahydromethanopterin S-methyltransferase subunit F
MVETPETTAYVPVNSIDPLDGAPPAYDATPNPDDEDGTDPEVLLVQNKPVTSSLRATILHLRQRAGYWSRFRGLSLYLVWNIMAGFIMGMLLPITRNRLLQGLVVIAVQVLFSRYIMTWVHIVISEPSSKSWLRRVPHIKTWPKMAPAVLLWAVCSQITSILPMLICGSFGSLKHIGKPDYEPDRKGEFPLSLKMAML